MPSPAGPALRDAAANPAHPALAPFPRRRESIVASATSSPPGVIPAHAGNRGVAFAPKRGARCANPAYLAKASFPRKRESIVVLAPCSPTAASPPDGVIPAHAGIQWRGVRSEARRSLRIALRSADRVSSGLRPAEQGGLCVPKAPLASPKGHPGKSPRALPVRAVPGKRRPREGRQTTRASCPRTVWLFPSRGRLFPATSRGPGALTRHPWLVGAATAR